MTFDDSASDAPPVQFSGGRYRTEPVELPDDEPSPGRASDVAMVTALAAHLHAHPDVDVNVGLSALFLWFEGEDDQLDAEQQALIQTLAPDWLRR